MDPKELPLRDIHLPDSVSWWPIAPGWWLILVALILIVMIVWAVRELHARRQLRRSALLELDTIQTHFSEHQELNRLASDCSTLLRRVALSRFPRQEVAGLTDQDWISFLNQQTPTPSFNPELSNILTHAPYQKQSDFSPDLLISACRLWLDQLPPQAPGTHS